MTQAIRSQVPCNSALLPTSPLRQILLGCGFNGGGGLVAHELVELLAEELAEGPQQALEGERLRQQAADEDGGDLPRGYGVVLADAGEGEGGHVEAEAVHGHD